MLKIRSIEKDRMMIGYGFAQKILQTKFHEAHKVLP